MRYEMLSSGYIKYQVIEKCDYYIQEQFNYIISIVLYNKVINYHTCFVVLVCLFCFVFFVDILR